ncbi:6941_t:CDS:2 [Diversispora eburnea]|uniref:6941_t:CDS:1 n=1 Tax=Diversispora eburnea TaxID=1213867 RepID=A0A9N9A2U3_9GLOM|nr:6941_t:CDS:2 [Diversispora eburnea]
MPPLEPFSSQSMVDSKVVTTFNDNSNMDNNYRDNIINNRTMLWSIFVLGHDCGHGSFSKYGLLNDTVGTFLHTLLLVPYTNWKLSHRHHHKNTSNIDKDEVFFPLKKSEKQEKMPSSEVIPYFGLGFGWLTYLLIGYGPRACSHINPFDPLFEKHRLGSIISLTSVIIALCLLSYGSIIWGTITMIKYYFLPWLVFSSWLVITTFLHHHGAEENIKLPWFTNEEWSYVVGNLSSVDRNYGILHNITHNIGTHQVHHLFPVIPHYYLKETTKIFQSTYPQFIRESNEPIMNTFISTFKLWKSQYLIDDDTKIFVYDKNRKQK